MARPTRTNAEWFMHPAAFRNDRRVKAIRARYGACGYGLLLMLIELLTDADNTSLATDDIEIELLAGDLSATAEEVLSLIQVGVKVGLFTRTDAGLLKCPQLDEWLAPVFEKRNRARNAAPAPKLSQPAAETGVSVTETTQSRVEKSREENSTVEKSTEQTSSFQSEDAASAAASAQEKKIEPEPLPESSNAQAPQTEGGAADVATSVGDGQSGQTPSAAPPKPARQPKLRRTVPNHKPEVAFSQTEYADYEKFAAAFEGSDYALLDLRYYHEKIKNWRDRKTGEQPTRKDWLATAAQFFLNDVRDNNAKLAPTVERYNPGTHGNLGQQPGGAAGGASGALTGQATTGYRSSRYD